MPVVVTGADLPVGRAVALALAAQGADVRATVPERALVRDLVDRGVKTAVWNVGDDAERLGAVLEAAYTVVHLHGGPDHAPAGLADVVDAADDSGVRRIVTLAPLAPLVTGGQRAALDALRASPYDAVVLRIGVAHDPDWTLSARTPPGAARLAPIRGADLVGALLAADRLREISGYHEVDAVGPAGVVTTAYAPGGPARRGLDRLLDRLLRRAPADLAGDGGAALAALLGVRTGDGRTA